MNWYQRIGRKGRNKDGGYNKNGGGYSLPSQPYTDRAQRRIHPYDFVVGLNGARTTLSKVLGRGVARKSHLGLRQDGLVAPPATASPSPHRERKWARGLCRQRLGI
ncbi:hypothetical protein OOU_Y34scaffold00697g44 [Pyricularia oryzae Y34]|uniref:Uncharacterized protein n=1 Tax=Pyricularia oryzae (strain Y34) TaxID=1143189 RepID=A0AA97NSM7_PYRO3|nr:hypothetical protein OOU_Y34scaffold00697g44 [Pyricularia oryzae Y34]